MVTSRLDSFRYTLSLIKQSNPAPKLQDMVTPIETFLQYKSLVDKVCEEVYFADYPKHCADKIEDISMRIAEDNAFTVYHGDSRCVLLIDNIAVKVDACCTGDNRQERYLYEYVKRNHRPLLQYLLPPIAYTENVTIFPKAEGVGQAIPRTVIDSIVDRFAQCNIDLYDLEDRWDNFGIYDGRLVIIDYAEWLFMKK